MLWNRLHEASLFAWAQAFGTAGDEMTAGRAQRGWIDLAGSLCSEMALRPAGYDVAAPIRRIPKTGDVGLNFVHVLLCGGNNLLPTAAYLSFPPAPVPPFLLCPPFLASKEKNCEIKCYSLSERIFQRKGSQKSTVLLT